MQNKEISRFYPYWVAFVAVLGGFLQSYVTCVIAGALPFISNEFDLTPVYQGHLASVILLGALVGSSFSGPPADRWGRRRLIILSGILYFATSLALFFTASLPLLMALRFATGLSLGITAMVIPLYLAEIAPPKNRGTFVALFQFAVTVGTLVAYGVNYLLESSGDWRAMLALAAIPAALQLFCFFSFPETPKWLFAHGQFEKGNEVLHRLQGITLATPPQGDSSASWKEVVNPLFRMGIFIGLLLSLFQQLCGINAIIYFTPKIFTEAGLNNPMFSTLLVGVVNLLATFSSLFLIDRLGRKKLLLISQVGVILSLLTIVFGFATESQWIDLLAVGAVLTFVWSYSLGLGPITWVLISEIYPLSIRAKTISIMTFFSWLSNYLVVLAFPILVAAVGSTSTFFLFFLLSSLALFLFARFVPETKGKSLEEIERMLYR